MFRSRLTSLFLLLASPAVGGTVLPVAHPCPVDAPWLAQEAGKGGHEHGGHHQHSKGPANQSGHTCTCPSACTAGLSVAVPTAFATIVLPAAPVRTLSLSADTDGGWIHAFLDRLPPSTAPPIA